jgi:hypothetical protein
MWYSRLSTPISLQYRRQWSKDEIVPRLQTHPRSPRRPTSTSQKFHHRPGRIKIFDARVAFVDYISILQFSALEPRKDENLRQVLPELWVDVECHKPSDD